MTQKSETRAGARASRNSCGGEFQDAFSPSLPILQLPPIIAQHLWRADELAMIEAAAMLMLALMGGGHHG
jgi:hypothetical protein